MSFNQLRTSDAYIHTSGNLFSTLMADLNPLFSFHLDEYEYSLVVSDYGVAV